MKAVPQYLWIKKLVVLLLALLIFSPSIGQRKSNPFNFGFEQVNVNEDLPKNWFKWGKNYSLKKDSLTKKSGKVAMRIEPLAEKAPNDFGCVAYAIPATYKAKEIEVKAYMKLENVSGAIGLMIRIDGSSGSLAFENMLSQKIEGTKDWTQYHVKVPYPENAKTIYIGAILSGGGQLWVDDFEVLLDGKNISEAKIIQVEENKVDADKAFNNGSAITDITLTPSKIEDLTVLGQIWGYLKYYHPAIASGRYNWDYELFRILPDIINVKNKEERNEILNKWVLSLGEFDITKASLQPKEEIKISPDLSWINEEKLGKSLTASLQQVKTAKRSEKHYYIDKMKGVGNPDFTNERPYNDMLYPDTGYRLLCLYRYWNMIAYYFPYKNLIEEDWNKVLSEYIPSFINAKNELDYKLSVLSLIARIHDTHANIWSYHEVLNEFKGKNYAPLEITFIENKAVVTDYLDKTEGEKTGLTIGDVIEKINTKTVEELIKEKLPFTPASNYPTQLRDIARNLLRTNEDSLSITYWNGKEKITRQIKALHTSKMNIYAKYQKTDTCFKLINKDIAYLYPGSIKNKYLRDIMNQVNQTKGLIIDFRSYPSDFIVFTLGEYLLPEPTSFVKFSQGSITTPGLFTMTKELKVGRSNKNYYKGKIVVLINETTQSSAEYHTMAFRSAPKAVVIGSTTAGADGNVSQLVLPGGIRTMISGIGVYYPDGRETQRIGILPDIEARPTIQGIKEKRDELLELAIKVINEQ